MANSEAIAWHVEEGQRLLEDQQRRAESLQTRAVQIAGFGAGRSAGSDRGADLLRGQSAAEVAPEPG